MLYKSLIRSRIEYGSFVFHPLNSKLSIRLERIQYKALRIALGLRRSTPTNVILAEAKIPPLNLRFEYLGNNFISRINTLEDHSLIPILDAYISWMEAPTHIHRPKVPCLIKNYIEQMPIKTSNIQIQHCSTIQISLRKPSLSS